MARKISSSEINAAEIRNAVAFLAPLAEELIPFPDTSRSATRWKQRKRYLAGKALDALENPKTAGAALWVAGLLQDTDAAVMAGDAEQAAFLASQLGRQFEGVELFPTLEYAHERRAQPKTAAAQKSQQADLHYERIRAAVRKHRKGKRPMSITAAGQVVAAEHYSEPGWSWGTIRKAICGMEK